MTRGHGDAEVDENYKSQNPNNKQLTMTEIVRDSLGLPTLSGGSPVSKFKTFTSSKKNPNMFGSLIIGI